MGHSPKPIRHAPAAAVRRPIFPRRRRRENIGFSVGRRRARRRLKISARRGLKREKELLTTFLQKK
jgi:hypothetical protein